MFIIRSGKYDWKYKKEKVIIFNTKQEAQHFFNDFTNFAFIQAMQMIFMDPAIIEDVQETLNNTKIISLPNDYKAETINFTEIQNKR